MKKLSLFLLLIISYIGSFAQVNGGFEQWNSFFPIFSFQEPNGYVSTNFAFIITQSSARQNVFRSTTRNSGSFAARLESYALNPTDTVGVPGAMFTGSVNILTQEIKTGFAFTGRPAELRGFYKYSLTNAPDSGLISIIFTKFNTALGRSIPVGGGVKSFSVASAFTAFSIPISFTSQDSPDSSIIVVSTTSAFTNLLDTASLFSAPLGVEMSVDDLGFFGTSGFQRIDDLLSNSKLYPNPVFNNQFSISYELKKSAFVNLLIYNDLGQLIQQKEVKNTAGNQVMNTELIDTKSGLYFYQLNAGDQILKGKFTILND